MQQSCTCGGRQVNWRPYRDPPQKSHDAGIVSSTHSSFQFRRGPIQQIITLRLCRDSQRVMGSQS
jgi:hypothetical protein